jgi:hypothetical protein
MYGRAKKAFCEPVRRAAVRSFRNVFSSARRCLDGPQYAFNGDSFRTVVRQMGVVDPERLVYDNRQLNDD